MAPLAQFAARWCKAFFRGSSHFLSPNGRFLIATMGTMGFEPTVSSPMATTPPYFRDWGRADDEYDSGAFVDNQIRPTSSGAAVDGATRIPSP